MDNSDKILNPTTGRYVKKTSALGKLILAGKTPTTRSKACSDSQIRNPNTNRCIKKDGRLAKSLGNSPASSSPIALPVTNIVVPPPPPESLTTISENKKMRNAQLSSAFINILKSNPNATPDELGNKYIKAVKNVNATTIQSAIRQRIARKKMQQQPEILKQEMLKQQRRNKQEKYTRKRQNRKMRKIIENTKTMIEEADFINEQPKQKKYSSFRNMMPVSLTTLGAAAGFGVGLSGAL